VKRLSLLPSPKGSNNFKQQQHVYMTLTARVQNTKLISRLLYAEKMPNISSLSLRSQ
jgi:hypothetical protein